MAIKDQCEQCKKYNSTCIENIEFNGQSCDHYIKRINLEKKTNQVIHDNANFNQQEKASCPQIDYPNPNDNIHGWLGFLLFPLVLVVW